MSAAVSVWLALILAITAGMKAWRADGAAAALATYGIEDGRVQRVTLWTVVALELGLAGAVATGARWAAGAVAGLFLMLALVTLAALLRGRAGRPCACFGSASRLGWSTPIRASVLALAAAVLALGWLPDARPGYDRWLTMGLAVGLAAIAVLAAAVLALAREVGVLRLEMSGRGALEIPEEGPRLGEAQTWAAAIPRRQGALLRLAVFTSEGCPLCRRVAPAVGHVAADPLLEVGIFDEAADAAIWARAAAPGSPYAVALDLRGVVLAKGTFNGLAQLESILATARARERGLSVAA